MTAHDCCPAATRQIPKADGDAPVGFKDPHEKALHIHEDDEALRHGREASQLAARARQRLLEQHRAFIADTVASHPAEVALVADAERVGYFVAVHGCSLAGGRP